MIKSLLIVVAALSQCSAPPPEHHVELSSTSCLAFTATGSGFIPGSQMYVTFGGHPPLGVPVGDDGTFAVALTRTPQDGQEQGSTIEVRQWAIGFDKAFPVDSCLNGGCA